MKWNENSRYFKLLNKKLLAIDYGEKVTGLCSFTPGKDPFPLLYGRVIVKNQSQVIEEISLMVEDDFFDEVIFGIPHLTDGTESKMTLKVKKVGEKLRSSLPIPVHFQDETLSTFEAEERMKNDPRYNFQVDPKKIDEVSASVIMEDFLAEEI